MLNLFRHIFPCFAAAILCLASPPSEASVFQITGEAWNGWVPTDGLSWEKGYEAEMIVNDYRQKLHFFSARYDQPVLQQIQQRLGAIGAELKYSTTEDGFSGIAKNGDFEVRILVSSPSSQPRHLIFLTYPDPKGHRPLKDPVQLYPNSKKMSSVANLRTGTHYITLKTTDVPLAVHEFYDEVLISSGWKRMTPSMYERNENGAMAVYQRKDKVCYIQVRQQKGLSSIITLLVKKGTM